MKTQKKFVVSGLIVVGLAAFCATGAEKKETTIARGDHTVTLRVGTEFTIRLEPSFLAEIKKQAQVQEENFEGNYALRFQWRKDTDDIPGATTPELRFNSIDFKDVASYSLVYWGEVRGEPPAYLGPEDVTAPVHLGVFIEKTGSTIGTVSYPLGAYGAPPPGGNVICGKTFDKWKAFEPFDGPNVSLPSVSYPNPNNHTKLKIDTCSSGNGPTLDTGIQIVGNFSPPPSWCNDNSTCSGLSNPLLSSRTITLQSGKTYRVGIFWKSGTQGNITTVTFNYTYFD